MYKPHNFYYPLLLLLIFFLLYSTSFNNRIITIDEGWIFQLSSRIADGETLYKDFYFARTPLTPTIQSLLMKSFPWYNVYWGKIYFGLEIGLALLLAYFILTKFFTPQNAFFYLLPAVFFVDILYNYPWYTTDAIFFGVLSLFLFLQGHQSKHAWVFNILSGIAVGFSFLSKQPFFILFAAYLILLVILPALFQKSHLKYLFPPQLHSFLPIAAGFLLSLLFYFVFLSPSISPEKFIFNTFVLPARNYPISFFELALERIPISFLKSIPIFLIYTMIFVTDTPKHIAKIIKILALTLLSGFFILQFKFFIVSLIVILVYALLPVFLIIYANNSPKHSAAFSRSPKNSSPSLFVYSAIFSIFLTYSAGFAHPGVAVAAPGILLSFPFAFFLIVRTYPAIISKFNLPYIPFLKSFKIFPFLGFIIITSILIHYAPMHTEASIVPFQKPSSFTSPVLSGLFSSESQTNDYNLLFSFIAKSTSPKDYIFVYPEPPGLYYYSNRRNPTPFDMYNTEEYNKGQEPEVMNALNSNRPKLIVLSKAKHADFASIQSDADISQAEGIEIYTFILANYKLAYTTTNYEVYLPKG